MTGNYAVGENCEIVGDVGDEILSYTLGVVNILFARKHMICGIICVVYTQYMSTCMHGYVKRLSSLHIMHRSRARMSWIKTCHSTLVDVVRLPPNPGHTYIACVSTIGEEEMK